MNTTTADTATNLNRILGNICGEPGNLYCSGCGGTHHCANCESRCPKNQ